MTSMGPQLSSLSFQSSLEDGSSQVGGTGLNPTTSESPSGLSKKSFGGIQWSAMMAGNFDPTGSDLKEDDDDIPDPPMAGVGGLSAQKSSSFNPTSFTDSSSDDDELPPDVPGGVVTVGAPRASTIPNREREESADSATHTDQLDHQNMLSPHAEEPDDEESDATETDAGGSPGNVTRTPSGLKTRSIDTVEANDLVKMNLAAANKMGATGIEITPSITSHVSHGAEASISVPLDEQDPFQPQQQQQSQQQFQQSQQMPMSRFHTKMKELQRVSQILLAGSMEEELKSPPDSGDELGSNLNSNASKISSASSKNSASKPEVDSERPEVSRKKSKLLENPRDLARQISSDQSNVDQTAEIIKVLSVLPADKLTQMLEIIKNLGSASTGAEALQTLSSPSSRMGPYPMHGMSSLSSNTASPTVSSPLQHSQQPQQQQQQMVQPQQDLLPNMPPMQHMQSLNRNLPQMPPLMQQQQSSTGMGGQDMIIKMISNLVQQTSVGDGMISQQPSYGFDPYGAGGPGGLSMSNFGYNTVNERQYDFDVTFMVSMPLLGQARREPIEVLAVHEEEDALRRALQSSQRRLLKFQRVPATVGVLRKTLTVGTRILHFCGHGIPRSLVFESGDKLGVAQRVPANNLQKITQVGGDDGLILVFLSACHSEEAAKAFVKAGAKHVVAVRREEQMHDTVARSFTEQFYTSLVQGKSVREAFDIARETLSVQYQDNSFLHLEHSKFILRPKDKARRRNNTRRHRAQTSDLEAPKGVSGPGSAPTGAGALNGSTSLTAALGADLSNNGMSGMNGGLGNDGKDGKDKDKVARDGSGLHDVVIFPKISQNDLGMIGSPGSLIEQRSGGGGNHGKHYPWGNDANGNPVGGFIDRTKYSCLKKFPMPPKCFIGTKRLALVHNLMDLVYFQRLVVLTGKKWVGKSALVNKVCHYLWERNKMDGIFVFDTCKLILDNPKQSLARLIAKNMRELGNAKDVIPENYVDTNEQLTSKLAESDKRYLLVFEDIDLISFASFKPEQRLDILLDMMVQACDKCHVLVTISTAMRRLDFLNSMANANGIQLHCLSVPPLESNESEALINEKLSGPTFKADQRGKIDVTKLAKKCHGLPGLIYYAIQQYNNNRNHLEDPVLLRIDEAIDQQRKRIANTSYYKVITIRRLNIAEISRFIKLPENRKLWKRLFGLQGRGDTITFINELFAIYSRLIGDQGNYRDIENYERDFISHELLPDLCQHRKIKYKPFDRDQMRSLGDADPAHDEKNDSNTANNANNNNNNNGKARGMRGIFGNFGRGAKKPQQPQQNIRVELLGATSSAEREKIEQTQVPIEVFEDVLKFWTRLVDVIMNPKLKKFYLYGSGVYAIRKARARAKEEQNLKDSYLKPGAQKAKAHQSNQSSQTHQSQLSQNQSHTQMSQLPTISNSSSSYNNGSSGSKRRGLSKKEETELCKNHYRIIIGLMTKEDARKLIQRFRRGAALIRFSRSTPGALAVAVSNGIAHAPTWYKIGTSQKNHELVFNLRGPKGSTQTAHTLKDMITFIPTIKYLYTHKNGNQKDEKLVERNKVIQWLQERSQ